MRRWRDDEPVAIILTRCFSTEPSCCGRTRWKERLRSRDGLSAEPEVSAFDGRQVESAQTFWISQDVDLNDLLARNGEAEHGKRSAVGTTRHEPKIAVDED